MPVRPAPWVLVLLALPGCGPCSDGGLDALAGAVHPTPAAQTVALFVGFPRSAHVALDNGSPIAVDVELAVDVPAGVVTLAEEVPSSVRVEAGRALDVPLHLVPTAVGAADVVLRVRARDSDVEQLARVTVTVAIPPPCAPSDPCETAVFDPDTGLCLRGALADGTGCDDDSACTTDDRCSSGRCLGEVLECHDGVDCTADSCDRARGCVFEPVASRCGDDNPCTDDVCDASAGCTNPVRDNGALCGTPDCATLPLCFFGVCTTSPTPDGFPCEDGDLCTAGDVCRAGVCDPGDEVDPAPSPLVHLARPTAHVPWDVRWSVVEEAGPAPGNPDAIDVPLAMGEALDTAQLLVDLSPRLFVLWRSQPFDVHGAPCDPWGVWPNGIDGSIFLGDVDPPRDSFCATAVVVTVVDERELSSVTAGAEVGSSHVLAIGYGTVDAAFERASLSSQELGVRMIESTYFPFPDASRELWLHRFVVDIDGPRGDVALRTGYSFEPGAVSNVHAGLRLPRGFDAAGHADDADLLELLAWNTLNPNLAFDRAGEADPGAALPVPPPAPIGVVRAAPVERGTWSPTPLLETPCPTAIDGASAPWTDVDVVDTGARFLAVARHFALDCTLTPEVSFLDVATAERTRVASAYPLAAALAPHGEFVAVVDEQVTTAECDGCPGATFVLRFLVDPSGSDPVVPPTIALDDLPGPARLAAVAPAPDGAMAAVVLDATFAGSRLVLVDERGARLASTEFAVDLSPLRALRSPLGGQAVYAVATSGTGDAVLERFGCPFPSAPTVLPAP